MNDDQFKFSNSVIALPLFFVLVLWVVYWLQIRFDFDFFDNGIYPRTLSGFQGVLFSPFIHSDLNHLYNNSIPLLVLLAALRYFYPKQTFSVVVFGILLSGALTWLIGRNSYHIGASGLIYVLVSFIFFKGIQTRYYRLVALSLSVIVLYGGMIWYVFPEIDNSISWEGHLSGFVVGLALSLLYELPEYKKAVVYEWQKPDFNPEADVFMRQFDEDGNFANLPSPEEDLRVEEKPKTYFVSNYQTNYEITKKKL
ncbi:rhomboid family intramembrane serine protease [Flavobacterium sp. TAB 87]|uniref:rhomboid family intramembrane serine protease n=1 Tax=Flavobacterium sp. TAB 87 TaxID=1729581 RepID=UPI00076DE282|nr:rhomboid family intramembrane serine protease [Flavobacterium sp. TAB 87]KVV13896.1 rhombosortase [Flavobacterium sp. TAB 87]